MIRILLFIGFVLLPQYTNAQQSFSWPEGKQMAMSLSFDDARESQVTIGTSLLDQYGVKATFYVVPSTVKKQLTGWKAAVKNGHEIGNHSLTHPCTGNFGWSRKNALEDYSLDRMRYELQECNRQIKELLQVDSKVFAYPCGQKFVGRGVDTRSYVPMVAEHFQSGRGWMDEAPNDPLYCNFTQLTCIEIDGKTFEQLLPLIDNARKNGLWLVFGGHEINVEGNQTTRLETLKKLMEYVKDPAQGIWLQPVGTVTTYIKEQRGISN
jgi:peptidoglycan/xylan/chitin deacetylase (PgdA/CDA1 family)